MPNLFDIIGLQLFLKFSIVSSVSYSDQL